MFAFHDLIVTSFASCVPNVWAMVEVTRKSYGDRVYGGVVLKHSAPDKDRTSPTTYKTSDHNINLDISLSNVSGVTKLSRHCYCFFVLSSTGALFHLRFSSRRTTIMATYIKWHVHMHPIASGIVAVAIPNHVNVLGCSWPRITRKRQYISITPRSGGDHFLWQRTVQYSNLAEDIGIKLSHHCLG